MGSRGMVRVTGRAALLASLLLAVGCGSGEPASPTPSSPPTASPTGGPVATPEPTPSTPTEGTVDEPITGASWQEPFELTLPSGPVVRGCEGDRLDLCVYDGDEYIGGSELSQYPVAAEDVGADPAELIRARATDFLEHFREDRAQGCADFTYEAHDLEEATLGGEPALRASFTLRDADGRIVERVINHFTFHRENVWLATTTAYAETGGCLAPPEYDPWFRPEHLDVYEQDLEALLAGTPLPELEPLTDDAQPSPSEE